MLKKKIFTILTTVAVIICILSACAGQDDGKYYGDKISSDTLRICIDPASSQGDYELGKMLEELAKEIKTACGIDQLAFELLPREGAERETALQRLRTEIMAGGGPDVFIMQTVSIPSITGINKSALFKFPEKNMEAGLFLPLDGYMENHSQFTDWSLQTKVVIDAGRNDEGQVIIPLTYTFPVLVYPESEANIPYTTELTMREILDDPETAEIGTLLYSDILKADEKPVDFVWRASWLLPSVLGKLADYENDELLVTEEELYEAITEMFALYDDAAGNQQQYMKNFVSYFNLIYEVYNAYFDTDMTLIPMYSKDGGVAASIRSYAAVNRNTNFPGEAFSVIDYLMQEKSQRESVLYSDFFEDGIPLQNDLGSEEKSLVAAYVPQRYLEEPYFEDLLAIKDQITAADFETELDTVLRDLVDKCQSNGMVSREDVSKAYKKMKRMMGE